jgi:hypothetical protein
MIVAAKIRAQLSGEAQQFFQLREIILRGGRVWQQVQGVPVRGGHPEKAEFPELLIPTP